MRSSDVPAAVDGLSGQFGDVLIVAAPQTLTDGFQKLHGGSPNRLLCHLDP
jgi:hypothetical protein